MDEDTLALAQHEGALTITHRLELTHTHTHTTEGLETPACGWLLQEIMWSWRLGTQPLVIDLLYIHLSTCLDLSIHISLSPTYPEVGVGVEGVGGGGYHQGHVTPQRYHPLTYTEREEKERGCEGSGGEKGGGLLNA